MNDVREFLESLFPQVHNEHLLQLIDLYDANITDIINHLLSHEDEDDIDILTKLFPASKISDIQTAWIESNGRLELAAQYLCENVDDESMKQSDLINCSQEKDLKDQNHESTSKDQNHDSNNLYILIEMFPDHPVELISSIFNDFGFENGISKILDLENTCKGDCIDSGFPCLLHSSNSNYHLNLINPVTKQKPSFTIQSKQNDFQYILSPITRSYQSEINIVLDESEISKGSSYLRNRAQDARKARNDAYQKASSTWKTNNFTAKGSASYYGLQGRHYHKEVSKWNALAVEALLRENHKDGVLDLHGFTVQEAIGVLPRIIQDWKDSSRKKFQIIVGRGNRSLTGSRLGPAVKKWLTDENIRFDAEPGSFNLVMN